MDAVKLGSLKSIEEFRDHLRGVAAEVPVDSEIFAGADSPLALPLTIEGHSGEISVGNRWAVHPMEGWDGTTEGGPSELTLRRWRHFGESGAKLIWGGEAVAVCADGRANPNQLVIREETLAGLESLKDTLLDAHRERWGTTDDFLIGLQLTHSGRFCRPREKGRLEPRVAYRHPILDVRVGIQDDSPVLSDAEIEALIGDYVRAAVRAGDLGFRFVDIKNCHGYLMHEFLGAHTRRGRYGGSFENRTRMLREIIEGIRRDAPAVEVGVRVSAFDTIPFRPDPLKSSGRKLGPGIPEDYSQSVPYRYGFGLDQNDPTQPDLSESVRLLQLLRELGIRLVNITGGSPYYNPHVQRPAYFPPSDGYQPPEDPLVGVVRQLRAVRDLKAEFPDLCLIGSALSYLQDFLPHVSQALVREGWMDLVGLGRMILTYWALPGDCLEGRPLQKRNVCRTFSDCTTATRNGLVSGCFPLDKHYAQLDAARTLKEFKRGKPEDAQ